MNFVIGNLKKSVALESVLLALVEQMCISFWKNMKKIMVLLCACLMAACGHDMKEDMQDKYDSRLVRLSKLEIHEEYLDEYLTFVGEVGRRSLSASQV